MPRRYSRQRELIFETLRRGRDHPTADMLHRRLKPNNPGLSLGTVYRNLKLLTDDGLILRLPFPVERFDGETAWHPHFCCKQCGAVYDLDLPQNESLDLLAAEAGHEIHRHELVFHGICANCRQEEEKMKFKLYRCSKCGNIVFKAVDSGAPLTCCGSEMTELKAGAVDAAQEKHVPVVTRDGNKIRIQVGSVLHPMLPEHLIQIIAAVSGDEVTIKCLAPGDEPVLKLCTEKSVEAYEYCNLHGLWTGAE